MGARQLQRAFPGFGAGVGEEDAVEAGALGEAQREFGLTLVIEEVRGVDERAALAGDGFFDCRMAVAERVDADAAEQIEILRTVLVNDVNAFAAHKEDRDCARRFAAAAAIPRREFDRVSSLSCLLIRLSQL